MIVKEYNTIEKILFFVKNIKNMKMKEMVKGEIKKSWGNIFCIEVWNYILIIFPFSLLK